MNDTATMKAYFIINNKELPWREMHELLGQEKKGEGRGEGWKRAPESTCRATYNGLTIFSTSLKTEKKEKEKKKTRKRSMKEDYL